MSEVFTAWVQPRWADLDAQGHVNNTVVLDYVRQARARFFPGESAWSELSGARVRSTQVQYLRPLQFAPQPLRVDLRVAALGREEGIVDCVVWDGSLPAARTRTRLVPGTGVAPPEWVADDPGEGFEPPRDLPVGPLGERGLPYDIEPRVSDMAPNGEIDGTRLYAYVQEARVAIMEQIDPQMARVGTTAWGKAVDLPPLLWLIAQQDIYYLAPVPYRPEPYRMWTAVVRVGTSSITINAELREGARPLMRAATVSVAADTSGHPVPLPEHMRASMEATMAAA